MTMYTAAEIDTALSIVRHSGYVAVKEKSYRAAQERQRVAQALAGCAERDQECTRRWAERCCDEERRLRDRLTYVYGVARAHGAPDAELAASASPTDNYDPETPLPRSLEEVWEATP